MGLPPNDILLRPPRPSIESIEWSKVHHERDCLQGVPLPRRRAARRVLSPLKAERRNGINHVAMCIMPNIQPLAAAKSDLENNMRPIPLPGNVVRELSVATAQSRRLERLMFLEQHRPPASPNGQYSVDDVVRQPQRGPPPRGRVRRHTVDVLEPIDITIPLRPRRARSAESPPSHVSPAHTRVSYTRE